MDNSTDHVTAQSETSSFERAEEAHAGLSFGDIPMVGGLLDIGARASVQDSSRTDRMTSDSTRTGRSNTSGQEFRTGAAFAHGLRHYRTPFPKYPVGSLLFVQLNDAGETVQADVLRSPHNTILAAGTRGVFVVNDVAGCTGPADALQVQVVNLRRIRSDTLGETICQRVGSA